MLEVDLLDLLMCMRPQIQIERDGAIGDDVDDGGVPVIQMPSENCSKAKEEGSNALGRTKVDSQKLKDGFEPSQINQFSLCSQYPRKDLIPTYRKVTQVRLEIQKLKMYARNLSISSEFCQLFFNPSSKTPNALDSS